MIPAFSPEVGALPVGRFPATIPEVERVLVDGIGSARRREVWEDWLDVLTMLSAHVRVNSAWLGGSFVTSKKEPDDIDCVFWVEDVELVRASRDPVAAAVVGDIATPGRMRQLRLRVDSYVVPWVSNGGAAPRGPADIAYHRQRGYWDDLWLRLRSGVKGAQPVRADSIPRRGYLEVNLDGYE